MSSRTHVLVRFFASWGLFGQEGIEAAPRGGAAWLWLMGTTAEVFLYLNHERQSSCVTAPGLADGQEALLTADHDFLQMRAGHTMNLRLLD